MTLKYVSSILFVFIISTLLSPIFCLYQDQVGKFDWRKQSIGIPKFVYQHQGLDNLIVATKSNVIASIHNKDGSIIWRQLIADGCELNHMSILKSSEELRDYLVRTTCISETLETNQTQVWSPQNGLLVSESRYRDFIDDDQSESQLAETGHVVDDSTSAFTLTDDSNLLVSDDGKVTYQAHGRSIWAREESLASIVAAEIVKLPKDMRDSFGLKKTIVVVTQTGKLFGMDTITGDIVWHLFDKDFVTSNHESEHLVMILTKQSDDDAAESRAIVIHPNGLIMRINPVTGESLEKKRLPASIKQIALTEVCTHDESRGILILDTQEKVHVYPENLIEQVKDNLAKYYITIAERYPASIRGFKFVLESNEIVARQVWSIPFNETEKIVNLKLKRIDEEIHSPARVLGDRGILYKYVNPNLVAVLTESKTGEACNLDHSINVYLIDGVTGALIHSIHHQKSRAPSKLVHSENWLVYSYFNTKSRRTEVSSMEMFEGIHQVNSSAFSSLTRSHIKPKLIEHKSFIFPAGIDSMVDTVTLRGMTNRHIIVALPSGALLEIPKIFLDPRRPTHMLPEHREEGLIPYMPELPIPSESIINYDQTLLKVRRIITSPAILESTSLVFAHGLDLFFTRVTPSKTFDILKDDFDHVLITGVLIFLVVASFVSKYLAQRKALHAAWR
uniref:ER membrane protein complex subunit 1 n=1 Tax=Aceria tosichella TaxID=561515 RepID=A0A6G1SBS8_9ACAR